MGSKWLEWPPLDLVPKCSQLKWPSYFIFSVKKDRHVFWFFSPFCQRNYLLIREIQLNWKLPKKKWSIFESLNKINSSLWFFVMYLHTHHRALKSKSKYIVKSWLYLKTLIWIGLQNTVLCMLLHLYCTYP